MFYFIDEQRSIQSNERERKISSSGSEISSDIIICSNRNYYRHDRAGYESFRPFYIQNRLPTYDELFNGQQQASRVTIPAQVEP